MKAAAERAVNGLSAAEKGVVPELSIFSPEDSILSITCLWWIYDGVAESAVLSDNENGAKVCGLKRGTS